VLVVDVPSKLLHFHPFSECVLRVALAELSRTVLDQTERKKIKKVVGFKIEVRKDLGLDKNWATGAYTSYMRPAPPNGIDGVPLTPVSMQAETIT